MIEDVDGFDWDAANIGKCEKHGLTIAMIEEFLKRELYILGDFQHSETEDRFIALGRTSGGRGIFVGFTFRQSEAGRLIRPITARFMHKREVEKYEKAIARSE